MSTLAANYNATVSGVAAAADLALITADTSGTVDVAGVTELTGTAAEIITAFGAYATFATDYNATITGAATTTQLGLIDADTTGTLTYSAITDSAANLATLAGGTWTAAAVIQSGTDVTVTGAINKAAYDAIDTANGAGTLTAVDADLVLPVFASAAVNGSTLVMTYTEATTLDATNIPATTAFAVSVGGSENAVTAVAVDASAKTVTLTLTTAVTNGQVVTVGYTDTSTGDDTNAIQDALGNDAATIAGQAVTNNTPASDTTARSSPAPPSTAPAWC